MPEQPAKSSVVPAPAFREPHAGGNGRQAGRDTSPVVCAASGRVREIAVRLADPEFLDDCAGNLAAGFGAPGESEVRSWRNSWPPLLAALLRAGLGELQLYLEYATPGGGQRLDALLLGASPSGELRAVVVELKQWQHAQVLSGELVKRSDGKVTTHPVQQVAAYLRFFEQWLPAGSAALDLRGLVLLHNATAVEGEALLVSTGPGAEVAVVTGAHLAGTSGAALAEVLGCADLVGPSPRSVVDFEEIRWTPSSRLLDQVGHALEGAPGFALVGDQQEAFLRIRAAVARARAGGQGAVITVHGGPGSGKTALAVRLLAHLMHHHPEADPRYVTPSGTLRAHLLEAAGRPEARDLFPPVSRAGAATRKSRVVIIDEAQRLSRGSGDRPPVLSTLLNKDVLVIFLDERQVVRPLEGVTIAEIGSWSEQTGRRHHSLALTSSFRCAGSKSYTDWVDQLLYDAPTPWTGADSYDLATCRDPFELQAWIEQATSDGHLARTAAGFCWPWTRNSQLHPDITIPVTDSSTGRTRTWTAAWNSAEAIALPDDTVRVPRSQLWASQPGGHCQVGCIYTAQGLEYHHAGIIIGPDLTWESGRWTAHPEASRDPALLGLPPQRYLTYALNAYRVLLTRGTHAARLYSTHAATQHLLTSLIRSR
jgi:hypothetical protein